MIIKNIINQNNTNFEAEYECQTCGECINSIAYNTPFFLNKVVPIMKCEKCGKSTISLVLEILKEGL